MKRLIILTAAGVACAALIPAMSAFARSRVNVTPQPVAPEPNRTATSWVSRRTLNNLTWQKRAPLLRRGTRGVERKVNIESSASSPTATSASSSSASSSSSGSAK